MLRYGARRCNRIACLYAHCTIWRVLTGHLSDYSGSQTKLAKILLNGNNVCMV